MAESRGKRCCRSFILEFHYSKLWFFYPYWGAFAFSPLLPRKYPHQALYLLYRWILSIYFLSWLIIGGVQDGPKYLIYLTHWGFIAYNAYLIVAALSVTVKHVSVYMLHHSEGREREHTLLVPKKPAGCCGYSDNKITWYQMIYWFLFTIGNEAAFIIMVLFWALVFRGEQSLSGASINAHLINGIFSIIDLWVSGVPVNLLHFVYLMIFGAVYAVFSGIYFAITGDIIYCVLNYSTNPGLAVGLCVLLILIFLPLVHAIVFYLQYVAKCWLFWWCLNKRREATDDDENVMEEATDDENVMCGVCVRR